MRINLIADQMEVNDYVRDMVTKYLAQKLEKHLPKFNQEIKTADLHLKKRTRWGYKLKFNMWLPQKKALVAETKQEGFRQALVDLRKKLITQIKKYKEELNYSSD